VLLRRVAFSFLEDIKNKFTATYGERGRTAMAYSMNEDFSRVRFFEGERLRNSGCGRGFV